MTKSWEAPGDVATIRLVDARLTLHWAAQLVGAAGAALVAPRPDDSHTALTCFRERSLLATAPFGESGERRVALSLPDLRVVVLDAGLEETEAFALRGKTLEEGRLWLGQALATALSLPSYDMPAHAVATGGRFTIGDAGPFAEMAKAFRNAATVLEGRESDAVVWPHHFDMAYLSSFADDKTIGLGWSPGDTSYAEPYWYVTPWPYPPGEALPELAAGRWHREGFVAAVLTHSEVRERSEPSAQRACVEEFLEGAVAASRALLGVTT